MDVKLYYIEGISRTDTPYFGYKGVQATLARQESYFATKLVRTVSTSFYPPHYTNEIKFETDDIDFDDNVNYLSLNFRNKTYYYFIDDIEYVNDTIIKLYITMDVIQTYMFDIHFSSAIIERKFINRWYYHNNYNQYLINRDYLRENVSDGLYELYEHTELTDYTTGFYFIKSSKLISEDNPYMGDISVTDAYGSSIKLGFTSFLVGVYPNSTNAYTLSGTTVTFTKPNLAKLTDVTSILDIYYCPFNPFDESKMPSNGGTVSSIDFSYYFAITDIRGFLPSNLNVGYPVEVKRELIDNGQLLGLYRNYSIGVNFSKAYMPVLLDENYQRITFGSFSKVTTYPLYKCDGVGIYINYYFNVYNGSRVYWINDYISARYSNSSFVDRYRTITVDDNKLQIELRTDYYKQYAAANKYRWLEATGKAGFNVAALFTSVAIKGAIADKDIKHITATHLTKVNKRLTKTGQRLIRGTQRDVEEMNALAPVKALGELAPITSQAITEGNMQHIPDTVRQSSSFEDVSNKSACIFYDIDYVNDIDQVAKYYHRNAYLVNEYVDAIAYPFEYVQNRYYFNLIKTQLAEVHLRNVIEDEATIALINERLTDGVRLWNINTIVKNSLNDPNKRYVDGTHSYTLRIPYLVSGTLTMSSTIHGSGGGSTTLDGYTNHGTYCEITYHTVGSGSSTTYWDISFSGTFTSPVMHIGDYSYDNVENDFIE